jgi:hypothetical protein
MAEQEELRLTVTLDDHASAQLASLRQQLAAMSASMSAASTKHRRQVGLCNCLMNTLFGKTRLPPAYIEYMLPALRAGAIAPSKRDVYMLLLGEVYN